VNKLGEGLKEPAAAPASQAQATASPAQPGRTTDDQGRTTGYTDAQGGQYKFGYGDNGQLNQVTDANGGEWKRQEDGTWKGPDGALRESMSVGKETLQWTEKDARGNMSLTRQNLESGDQTKYDWSKKYGAWRNVDAQGNDTVLYKDNSTVNHDDLGRVTGFKGQGGIQTEIKNITEMTDPKQRNLRITQMYSDLGRIMGDMIPGGGNNWSNWATWASREAGSVIRGESIPKGLQGRNGLLDSQHALTRQAIAYGNLDVFREIAPQMARFIDTFQGDTKPDAAKLAKFQQGLDPEKQVGLRTGFEHYYNAMFAPNQKAKQDSMLKGNLAIAIHEQLRLDNMIDTALPDYPGARRAATATMMGLTIPGQRFSLAGAGDWTNFGDRMSYLRELFTANHNNGMLTAVPFPGYQVRQITNGGIPADVSDRP